MAPDAPLRRAALAALLLCAPLACNSGTTLLVKVEYGEGTEVRQLRFTGEDNAGGSVLFGPELRPAKEGVPLVSPQSVRISFSDSLGGSVVQLEVDALRGGEVVGSADKAVTLTRNAEVTAVLTLGAPREVGGPDGGVDGGVDAGSCAGCGGCCSNGVCLPGDAGLACGRDGGVCEECNPAKADNCATGACRCGANPACGPGQSCDAGTCTCGPGSCDGCCSGSTCLSGREMGACGNSGGKCSDCGGSACTDAGTCASCNPGNCPGCCNGASCVTPSASACGADGGACMGCDPIRADRCTPTGCTCANVGSICAPGQHCVDQTCKCDVTSCPLGCCSGVACLPGDTNQNCGTAAQTCKACPVVAIPPQSCVNHACK